MPRYSTRLRRFYDRYHDGAMEAGDEGAGMKVLSLFSGIGGFDLGLERAGMTIVGQAEIDPFCSRVLAHHWPGVRNYGDVRNVGCHAPQWGQWREAEQSGRTPDLICGGFPCQDLSVAGKRAGLDGERSGLWFEFQRVLSELRPQWCLIENVPGLLSSNGGRDFGVILDGLGECGFGGIAWAVLDSQHFGVPQRRRRVFIVGGPTRRSVEQVLSLCESCGGHPQKGREAGEDVAAPLGASTTSFGGQRYDLDNETYVPDIAWALQERDAKGPDSDTKEGHLIVAHSLRAEGFDASEDGTGRGTPLYAVRTAQTHANGHGVAEGVAHTLDGANAQALAGASVRRLTPTECARLQGFPDDWLDLPGVADGPKYRALGNAVTVPVIEYLGLRIMAIGANP